MGDARANQIAAGDPFDFSPPRPLRRREVEESTDPVRVHI